MLQSGMGVDERRRRRYGLQTETQNEFIIAVDNGPEPFVCAGPVLSHYDPDKSGR